jgi:hypothetical protein
VIVSSRPTVPSTESQETGLWLWQGKRLSPPSPSQPASQVQQSLDRIVPVARLGGWMALTGGLALMSALILLAVMLHLTLPDKPVPADARAVALPPVPSPTVAHPIIPTPPVELTDAQLDEVQMPSAPDAQMMARWAEHQVAKKRVQRTSHPTARKTHVSFARRGSPVLIPGVLTPPEQMTRHGGSSAGGR